MRNARAVERVYRGWWIYTNADNTYSEATRFGVRMRYAAKNAQEAIIRMIDNRPAWGSF